MHYRFVSDEEFDRLEREGAFLESAVVHGARYGTPRAPVEQALEHGETVILEIDVQGARQVKAAIPEAVTVFIEPPSEEALVGRLTGRATETPEALQRRLATARAELAEASRFDHRVVNDRVDDAVAACIRILEGPHPSPKEENA